MKLTVDASVVVKSFVDEPLGEEARLLLAHRLDLCAPALLITEFANTIWKKVRRGEIPDSKPYFDELAAIAEIVDLVPDADVVARVAAIAVDYPVSTSITLGTRKSSATSRQQRPHWSSARTACRN